jgi:hypothetical protein
MRASGVSSLSFRLSQRVVGGFVKAVDFTAIETLIPNLQPRAEGFGRSQVLDGEAERPCHRRETAILAAKELGRLGQEQFSRGVVVEG